MSDTEKTNRVEGQGELGLEDAEFWSDPFRTRDEVEGPLLDRRADRLILDGPRAVPLEGRITCPIAALRVTGFAKMCTLVFEEHAVVTAVELTGNRVHANLAVRPVDNRLPSSGTGDEPSNGPASEAFRVDLRERLRLPWRPAEYLVTVLLRDEVSPRIRVSLTSSAYEDAEAKRFLQQRRLAAPPPSIHPLPGSPLPSFRPSTTSPRIPDSLGVALAVRRVAPIEPGAPCVLHASFRLPVRDVDLVERADGARLLPEDADLLHAEPTAVAPITLLITGADSAAPVVLRVVAPSFEPITWSGSAPIATGYFTVDLGELGLPTSRPETFFIYAFSGEVMSGPVLMALVRADEDLDR